MSSTFHSYLGRLGTAVVLRGAAVSLYCDHDPTVGDSGAYSHCEVANYYPRSTSQTPCVRPALHRFLLVNGGEPIEALPWCIPAMCFRYEHEQA